VAQPLFAKEGNMTQQQTVSVTPASWEAIGQLYALFPMMLIFMVLGMSFRLINQALKPETLRELKPIAETALMAKGSGKYLAGGV
jgi:hypothetical protein